MTRMRLHFHDEAPRIGSGLRGVEVTMGRKWVRIRDPHTGKRSKLSIKLWRATVGRAPRQLTLQG